MKCILRHNTKYLSVSSFILHLSSFIFSEFILHHYGVRVGVGVCVRVGVTLGVDVIVGVGPTVGVGVTTPSARKIRLTTSP